MEFENLVKDFYTAHEELHSARWGGTMDEIEWREEKLADLRAKYPELSEEAEKIAIDRYNEYLRGL